MKRLRNKLHKRPKDEEKAPDKPDKDKKAADLPLLVPPSPTSPTPVPESPQAQSHKDKGVPLLAPKPKSIVKKVDDSAKAQGQNSHKTVNFDDQKGETKKEAIGLPNTRRFNLDAKLKEDAEKEKKALKNVCWFHDQLNRNFAEIRLREGGMHNGLYLVRDSAACPGDYVLSLVHNNECVHFQVHRQALLKYAIKKGDSHAGLDLLIDHYSKYDGGLPTKLTRPCEGGTLPPPLSIYQGYTNLLHSAIADNNETLATSILQHRECPEVNSKDEKGSTTLHLACTKGMDKVVRMLVAKGAMVTVRDRDGHTALDCACLANKAPIVRYLIETGKASPMDRNPVTGDVALHLAARHGYVECVKELLAQHAPAWPQNGTKSDDTVPKTPHELATKFGHKQCADLIDAYVPPNPTVFQKDWFHEGLDRAGAVELMSSLGNRDGMFLVRASSRQPDSLVLTAYSKGNATNLIITKYLVPSGSVYYIDYGPYMPSLEHLMDYLINGPDHFQLKLRLAIKPDGKIKSMVAEDEDEDEDDPYIQYVVSRRTSSKKHLPRKDSVPELPPPPPPVSRQRSNPLSDSGKFQGHVPLKHSGSAPMTQPRKDDAPQMLEATKITLLHELGQGEYGSVMKGTYEAHEGLLMDVAIKTMNKKHADAGKDVFLNEAKVMVKLNHPCIVKLIGMSEGPPPMLVEELLSCGSMLDFLLDYPEQIHIRKDLYLWAGQIANGMTYLESRGFVHRDLAARNVLLESKKQVKVSDFGLSRAVQGDHDYYTASEGGRWPIKWYAPESVNFGTFSSASDVWGFGITLWEMFSFGDQPYGHKTGAEVVEFLENNGRLDKPEKCPKKVYEVMLLCWSYNSHDRPNFKDLFGKFRQDPEYMNTHIFPKRLDSKC